MIINLRLKNFFSLADEVALDFTAVASPKSQRNRLPDNLLDFNGDNFVNIIGLFGSNAAGKSNLIKAVEFCRNLVLKSHLNNEGERFEFEPYKFRQDEPSEFSISFVTEGIEYEYSFELLHNKVISESLYYYPQKRRAKIFSRENTDSYSYGKGVVSRPGEIEANTGPQTLFLSRASTMNRPVAQTVYRFFRDGIRIGVNRNENLHSLREEIEENKPLLLKALEVSDSDIVDFKAVESVPGHLELLTFHKGGPGVPFNFDREESEGTKRLFYILLTLIQTARQDTTIFFDEFDLKLHLRLAEFLLDVVRVSKKSQLVFTSHNPGLINREMLRDEQIVFVTKLQDGKSEFIPLSDYSGISKIKDIRLAYLQGRFDGVPYIGNVFTTLSSLNSGRRS